MLWNDGGVEFVGFATAQLHNVFEISERILAPKIRVGQAQANDLCFAGLNRDRVMRCSFRSPLLRVYRISGPLYQVLVDSVFYVRRSIFHAKKSLEIRFILGK